MMLQKRMLAALIFGLSLSWGGGWGSVRADEQVRPAKAELTPQNFAALHALIRPHASEWRHLRVDWLTDVVAARKKAAAEDKPIVICYTGGAGYNEPLGTC